MNAQPPTGVSTLSDVRSSSWMHCSSSNTSTLQARPKYLLRQPAPAFQVRHRRSCNQHVLFAASNAAPSEQGMELADPWATIENYDDNWFDRVMISYFSKRMAQQLGVTEWQGGYDGFVELSKQMMRGRNSLQQQQTVAGVLESLLPPDAPNTFRKLFPFSRWTAEINAWITVKGFAWLVGPMEIRPTEVEYKGQKQTWNSGVHIKKCRYLEASKCAGICTNLCKLPTQAFFTDTFGLPLTMDPDFEDLSCEMRFGVQPPPVEQDAVYGQPCYSVCEIAREGLARACHRIDTDRGRKGLSDAAVPASMASKSATST